MERVKEANKILKIYPKLQLGKKIMKNGKPAGVESTGLHTIKIIEEPTTTMVRKTNAEKQEVQIKAFKFIVEEGGKLYKWLVPMTDATTGEGHYLMEHLQDIDAGEEFTVEMKKEQGRNFVELKRPNADADDIEEIPAGEHDYGDEPNLQG